MSLAKPPDPKPLQALFSQAFFFLFPLVLIAAPLYRGAVSLWYFSLVVFVAGALFYAHRLMASPPVIGDSVMRQGMIVWTALYLIFFTASALHTQIPYKSLNDAFKTLAVMAVFYFTLGYCDRRQRVRALALMLTLLGAVLSVYGLLQYLGAFPKEWWHRPHFLSSVYVNHNHFAGLLEITLPLALGLAVAERQLPKKALIVFLAGVMAVAFVFTLSRGGLIALVVSLGFMLFAFFKLGVVKKNRGLLIAFAAIVLCFLAAFGVGPLMERVDSVKNLAQTQDVSIQQRFLIWRGTLAMILSHPWLGTGPGTFDHVFLKFRPDGFFERPGFAHNDYLQLVADCGVFSFLTVIAFFSVIFLKGLETSSSEDSRLKIGIGVGCLGAMLCMAVHSVTDFNFHVPANFLLAGVVLAMLFSLGDLDKEEIAGVVRRAPGPLTHLLFAVLFLSCGVLGFSDYYVWKSKGLYAAGQVEQAMFFLDKSAALNPLNAETRYLRSIVASATSDWKGAAEGLDEAVRLDPYEPYYYLLRAKARSKMPDGVNESEMAAYFEGAVKADPKDPKINFLAGQGLLKWAAPRGLARARHRALTLLRNAVLLDPGYALLVYQTLWVVEGDIGPLVEFNQKLPQGLKGFVDFLEKADLWKYHRTYYLLSLGLDAQQKYRLESVTPWDFKSSESHMLSDFNETGKKESRHGELFYRNGLLEKNIMVRGDVLRLAFQAKGQRKGNSYPYLLIRLDGAVVDTLYIDNPEYMDFVSAVPLRPGVHTLGIEFVNHYPERMLWIKKVEIAYPRFEAQEIRARLNSSAP